MGVPSRLLVMMSRKMVKTHFSVEVKLVEVPPLSLCAGVDENDGNGEKGGWKYLHNPYKLI